MNLDQTFKARGYKTNRIPSYLGTSNELFRTSLRHHAWLESANDNFMHVYNTGWNGGKEEGVREATITTMKNMMLNGDDQVFIDKTTGGIYPFSNIHQLTSDEKGILPIKLFLLQQHEEKILPELEKEYEGAKGRLTEHKERLRKEKMVSIAEKLSGDKFVINESKKPKVADDWDDEEVEGEVNPIKELNKKENEYENIDEEQLLSKEYLDPIKKEIRTKAKELGLIDGRTKDPAKILEKNKEKIEEIESELNSKWSDSERYKKLMEKRETLQTEKLRAEKEKKDALVRKLNGRINDINSEDRMETKKERRLKKELTKHKAFEKEIDRTIDLFKIKESKKQLRHARNEIENLSNPNYRDSDDLANSLRSYNLWTGEDLTLDSDFFQLYRINKLRNAVNPDKKERLVEMRVRSANLNEDNKIEKGIKDYRTKKGPNKAETTFDLIKTPPFLFGNKKLSDTEVSQMAMALFRK